MWTWTAFVRVARGALLISIGLLAGYVLPHGPPSPLPDAVEPAPDGEEVVRDTVTNQITGIVETLRGQRHGDFRQWFPNGRKDVAGQWRFGAMHGEWTYYDSAGNVIRREWWDDGKMIRGE